MGIDDTPSRGRPMNDRRPQPVARMSVSEMRGGAARTLDVAEPVIGPRGACHRAARSLSSGRAWRGPGGADPVAPLRWLIRATAIEALRGLRRCLPPPGSLDSRDLSATICH